MNTHIGMPLNTCDMIQGHCIFSYSQDTGLHWKQ